VPEPPGTGGRSWLPCMYVARPERGARPGTQEKKEVPRVMVLARGRGYRPSVQGEEKEVGVGPPGLTEGERRGKGEVRCGSLQNSTGPRRTCLKAGPALREKGNEASDVSQSPATLRKPTPFSPELEGEGEEGSARH